MSPSAGILLAALAVDLLCGELPARLHPVVWIGKTVSVLTSFAPRRGRALELAAGAAIALCIPASFSALSAGLVHAAEPWPIVSTAAGALLLKSTFAVRGLGRAAFAVRDALAAGRLSDARLALRSLCSRSAAELDPPLLVAATVESVAENASDSFVAPLFYYALFGLPGAAFYRAVNTLDSMIGYRGRYEYLGKASARLDDAANFVPARITATLLLLAGWLGRADVGNGWRILQRDAHTTESPNAGRPMAVMAGLLGVRLEKPGHYRLGDPKQALAIGKIDEAWRIVAFGAVLAFSLAALAAGFHEAHGR
jgi:adenosylcobinamide-phosphate synthase